MRTFLALAIVFLTFGLNLVNSARILGIFPLPSVSHQVVFRALTLALNQRGHELIVITTDPINDPTLKEYTEIDMSIFYDSLGVTNYIETRRTSNWLEIVVNMFDKVHSFNEAIFEKPEFRRIYDQKSDEKFDLLIVETLYGHAFYALAARFNVPIIGITSLGLSLPCHHAIGNPILASHPSNWELERNVDHHLGFWKRLENFIKTWRYLQYFETQFIPRQDEIAKKYLGSDTPYVGDIEKNISLIFMNQQAPLSHNRPNIPKVIAIGGFHVSKELQSLPEDLKTFLDGATDGFVYMSLGSNIKSRMLSESSLGDFMTVFSKLPQRVLWKFENDSLPGKPTNVYISKWLPQQAVLAHRNIKAFIYQGGLQSTEEAVDHAVPLIGIPIFADQDSQVSKMVSLGVARKLEINDLARQDLETALHDVINNKSYKEKMLVLRSFVKDRPFDPLQNAVWWTEFVIRHKGAPHLQSGTVYDPWYQQYDMDIVAFISVTSFTMLIMFLVVFQKSVMYGISLIRTPITRRKQKSS